MIITITNITSDNVNMHHASYAKGPIIKYGIDGIGRNGRLQKAE